MKRKLFFRNLLILILAILIPALAVAHISLKYSQDAMRKKEITAAKSDLELMSQYIDSTLQLCSAVAAQIENDTSLLEWMNRVRGMANTSSNVLPMFQRWTQYTDLLISNGVETVWLYQNDLPVVLSTNGLLQMKTLRDQSWLEKYRSSSEWFTFSSHLTCTRTNISGEQLVSFMIPLMSMAGECKGVFVVDLSQLFLQKICERSSYKNAMLYLISSKGEQLYPAGNSIYDHLSREQLSSLNPGAPADLQGEMGGSYIVISHESSRFDWSFYLLVEENALFADLRGLERLYPVLLAAALLIATSFALFYTFQNVRPVAHMVSIIEQYNQSGIVPKPKASRSDVYNHIIYTLVNALVEKNELRLRVARLELNEKEAQMHAIQSRINPHFLYNSLEVANWAAIRKLGQPNEVSYILKTMADNFRNVFSDRRLIVSLREELEQLERYIEFLKYVDYREMHVTIDAAQDTLDVPVPRLLIQPLIENAYVHGLAGAANPCIHIRARLHGDMLEMSVTDNGSGLEAERLAELNHTLAHQTDLSARGASGLLNVNNRLSLRYGQACHLVLYSRKGCGTAVQFRIPARTGPIPEEIDSL